MCLRVLCVVCVVFSLWQSVSLMIFFFIFCFIPLNILWLIAFSALPEKIIADIFLECMACAKTHYCVYFLVFGVPRQSLLRIFFWSFRCDPQKHCGYVLGVFRLRRKAPLRIISYSFGRAPKTSLRICSRGFRYALETHHCVYILRV